MKLTQLRIENFKAISLVELEGLANFVLIAGPNGVGKSCVLDAVRMLKSHHAGYVPNEIDHLYGEFQLDTREPSRLRPLFRNVAKPIRIAAAFTLSEVERHYLLENRNEILA